MIIFTETELLEFLKTNNHFDIRLYIKDLKITDVLPTGENLLTIFDYLRQRDLAPYVSKLDLECNALTSDALHSRLFKGMCNLEVLNLNNNALVSLPDEIFRDLINLETLELDNNILKNLSPGSFTGLNKLRHLSLEDNYLECLPETVFHNLTTVYTLSLSHNRLKHLPQALFKNLSKATEINLTNNQLESLPKELLHNLSDLTRLSLDCNRLESLPEGLFRDTRFLESIDLSENRLLSFLETGEEGLDESTAILQLHNFQLHENGALLMLEDPDFFEDEFPDADLIYKHIVRCHFDDINILNLSLIGDPEWACNFTEFQRDNLETFLKEEKAARQIEIDTFIKHSTEHYKDLPDILASDIVSLIFNTIYPNYTLQPSDNLHNIGNPKAGVKPSY
jgi:hypothetical protein